MDIYMPPKEAQANQSSPLLRLALPTLGQLTRQLFFVFVFLTTCKGQMMMEVGWGVGIKRFRIDKETAIITQGKKRSMQRPSS